MNKSLLKILGLVGFSLLTACGSQNAGFERISSKGAKAIDSNELVEEWEADGDNQSFNTASQTRPGCAYRRLSNIEMEVRYGFQVPPVEVFQVRSCSYSPRPGLIGVLDSPGVYYTLPIYARRGFFGTERNRITNQNDRLFYDGSNGCQGSTILRFTTTALYVEDCPRF